MLKGEVETPRMHYYNTMSVHLMHMEAAGEAVLVAFDRAGATSRSYSPVVDGRVVRFSNAGGGKMKDSATGSIWDVGTGECERGELKGKRLAVRPGGRTMVRSHRSADEQDEKLAS